MKKQITEVAKATPTPLEVQSKSNSKVCINSGNINKPENKISEAIKTVNPNNAVQPKNEPENNKEVIKNVDSVNKEKLPIDKSVEETKEMPIIEKEKPLEIDKKEEAKMNVHNEESKEPERVEASSKKILNLEILESLTASPGTILTINSEGLLESKRNAKDGHTFFGSYNGTDISKINDYIFVENEKGIGQRHFEIEYNSEKNVYFLKDLNNGSGTFARIVSKFPLINNIVLSFGCHNLDIIMNSSQDNPVAESYPKEININPPKKYPDMYFGLIDRIVIKIIGDKKTKP